MPGTSDVLLIWLMMPFYSVFIPLVGKPHYFVMIQWSVASPALPRQYSPHHSLWWWNLSLIPFPLWWCYYCSCLFPVISLLFISILRELEIAWKFPSLISALPFSVHFLLFNLHVVLLICLMPFSRWNTRCILLECDTVIFLGLFTDVLHFDRCLLLLSRWRLRYLLSLHSFP